MKLNLLFTEQLDSIDGFFNPDNHRITTNDLFFFERSGFGIIGEELWVSDGTPSGTYFLTSLQSGQSQSSGSPNDLTGVGGTAFFTRFTNEYGNELWKSDGTVEGTQLVKDIKIGSSFPSNLTAGNNIIYFTTNSDGESVTQEELWKSDGTPEGTQFITMLPDRIDSVQRMERLFTVNDTLFFVTGNEFTTSDKLWRSDGTPEGTELVHDFGYLGLGNGAKFYNFDDQLFINATGASQVFWKSDGTEEVLERSGAIEEGLEIIKRVVDLQFSDAGPMYGFNYSNGTIWFGHDDGTTGAELWKSDGTAEGTQLVKDIGPTTVQAGVPINESSFPFPTSLSIGDNSFFLIGDVENDVPKGNNLTLWQTDGTAEGTQLVTDSFYSYDLWFELNDKLVFSGVAKEDSSFPQLNSGIEGIWISDGTEAGTRLLIDPEDFTEEEYYDLMALNMVGLGENIAYITTARTSYASPELFSLDLNNLDTESPNNDSLMNTSINRFHNYNVPGTYLFAGDEESQGIRDNFPNFKEEGLAFKVAVQPGDSLIPLYRFQSTRTPGTYLLAGEEERQNINQNFSEDFNEEGLAFYVYGAGSGHGTTFYRFQNTDRPGTYLFAGPEERQGILENFPNFMEEGPAFDVGV